MRTRTFWRRPLSALLAALAGALLGLLVTQVSAQELPAPEQVPTPIVIQTPAAPVDAGSDWTPTAVIAVLSALGLLIERLYRLVSATRENTRAVKAVHKETQDLVALQSKGIPVQRPPNPEASE